MDNLIEAIKQLKKEKKKTQPYGGNAGMYHIGCCRPKA